MVDKWVDSSCNSKIRFITSLNSKKEEYFDIVFSQGEILQLLICQEVAEQDLKAQKQPHPVQVKGDANCI